MRSEFPGTALKAAEVGSTVSQPLEQLTSGAKARVDIKPLMAQLKPCPDAMRVVSASSGATAFIAVCLLILLPLAGCGPKTPVAADQPVPVRVRVPNRVQQPVSVAASGAVEANVTAMSAFQIAGRVARVFVEDGQAVGKGQVLAELDATDYRNAYDAAQGQADAALAVDRKAQEGPRAQELEQARIDFDRWQDEYKRMKFLYDHQSLPANDFKKIEAGYQAAQQRYDMAKQGTRVQDKEAANGQARAAAAGMHEAQKRLGDTKLRAPIAGANLGLRRDAAYRCGRYGWSGDSRNLRAGPGPCESARGDS